MPSPSHLPVPKLGSVSRKESDRRFSNTTEIRLWIELRNPKIDSFLVITLLGKFDFLLRLTKMNALLGTRTATARVIRGVPVLKDVRKRQVSTQELDASKGGRFSYVFRLSSTRLLTTLSPRESRHLGLRVSCYLPLSNSILTSRSWSGFVLSRELDKKKFQTVVVSPRSYFVFTPLLASTAVGTLEFRTTLESVRARGKGVEFFQGWADDVNFSQKKIAVEELSARRPLHASGKAFEASSITEADVSYRGKRKGKVFELNYDKLVVAVGCYSQTFNTAGVKENAFFLKDVVDARKIRKRILECEFPRATGRVALH